MAKSIQPVIEAFLNGKNKKVSNTKSINNKLYLFENIIAKINLEAKKIAITTNGWNTATTRSRLNMLPGVNVRSKKGQLYIKINDDKEWEKWNGYWYILNINN